MRGRLKIVRKGFSKVELKRRPGIPGLGPLETAVMEIVWSRGAVTVGQVAEGLANGKPPAYTTVMTVLTRLFEKGLLAREPQGRAYSYQPTKTRTQYLEEVAQARVRSLITDFGDVALAQFLAEIEKVDPSRLARLAEFIEKRKSNEDREP